MNNQRANKLDHLFQEKLQDHEISPDEDIWPYLEKNLNKTSFYKFGWRHINIYNISVGILLLLIPFLYFFLKTDRKDTIPAQPKQEISDSIKSSTSVQNKPEPIEATAQPIQKKQKKQKTLKPDSSNNPQAKTRDSLPAITPVEEVPVVAEPVKAEEKKTKPKKIIYVVQQDTIVERDTIKVRRKRKK